MLLNRNLNLMKFKIKKFSKFELVELITNIANNFDISIPKPKLSTLPPSNETNVTSTPISKVNESLGDLGNNYSKYKSHYDDFLKCSLQSAD